MPFGRGYSDKAFVFNNDQMNKQIIHQNLQWCVTESGDLLCVDRNYEISRETLESIDWITHMKEKDWCNDFYFRQAFEYSLKHTK